MKKLIGLLFVLALAGAGAAAYAKYYDVPPPPDIATIAVTQGEIVDAIKSTGTLSALRTVDVGTQVSGIVDKLYVDFNSIVKKGELIAELDPLVLQAAVDSAIASEQGAEIDMQQHQQTLDSDRKNYERSEQLLAQHIATEQDRDTAKVLWKQDEAQIIQDQATIVSAKAAVEEAKVNLSYCTILSPIDGVVIARNVDEGQAVQSHMATPSLYLLGTDLKKLQLIGDVDEANVGRIRPGQIASFTVDAYPNTVFHGRVNEVRLNATTINNVVTYQIVVFVDNPDLKLIPSMTATMSVEISRADNVLRVSNAALRFGPTPEMLAAVNHTTGAKAPAGSMAGARDASVVPASMTTPTPQLDTRALPVGGMIDNYFEPLPPVDRPGHVWTIADKRLEEVPIELGMTDGTWTQIIRGDVHDGEALVTGVALPMPKNAPVMPAGRSNNPFTPNVGRGR